MYIKKIYETVLNISPAELYGDIDAICLKLLRERYNGKCNSNTFIINIEKIIKRSTLQISKGQSDGGGQVNVQFLATAISYDRGTILPTCLIQAIEKNSRIMCTYGENVIISIKGNKTLQNLSMELYLPIIVQSVNYKKYQSKITVQGVPFQYSRNIHIYALDPNKLNVSSENIKILETILSNMNILKKNIGELSSEEKTVFNNISDLYYPYVSKYETNLKTINKKIKLIEIELFVRSLIDGNLDVLPGNGKNPLYIIIHPIINKTVSNIMIIDSTNLEEGLSGSLFDSNLYEIKTIEETPVKIATELCSDFINYNDAILQSAKFFSENKKYDSNKPIWDIYKKIKIE